MLSGNQHLYTDSGAQLLRDGAPVGGGGTVGTMINTDSLTTGDLIASKDGTTTNMTKATSANVQSAIGAGVYAPLTSPSFTTAISLNGQSIETQFTNRVLKAGDTMSGTLAVSGFTNSARTASTFVVAAADKSDTSTATSAELAATLSDEVGSGHAVFDTSPSFVTSVTLNNASTTTVPLTINHASAATAHFADWFVGAATNFAVFADGSINLGNNGPTLTSTGPFINMGSTAPPSNYGPGFLHNKYIYHGNGPNHAFGDVAKWYDNASTADGYCSFDSWATIGDGNNRLNHCVAFQARQDAYAMSLQNMYGLFVNPTIRATCTNVVNVYGAYIAQPTVTLAAAGFTNQANYGVYVGTMNNGQANYSLYTTAGATNVLAGSLVLDKTVTAAGTTGDQTINKTSGRVNFAIGAQSITVTCDLCATTSIIVATVGTDDATAFACKAIPGSGSFVLKLNATATAETAVNWIITN